MRTVRFVPGTVLTYDVTIHTLEKKNRQKTQSWVWKRGSKPTIRQSQGMNVLSLAQGLRVGDPKSLFIIILKKKLCYYI